MTTQTTTQAAEAPSAWIGCLHCYNAGRLVGRWFDLTDPEEVEIITGDNENLANPEKPFTADNPSLLMSIHRRDKGTLTSQCEELWVMDHENLPIRGECDPMSLAQWAEAYEQVTLHDSDAWPAFVAWTLNNHDSAPSPDSFTDSYRGEWGSFQDYAESFADDMGDFQNVPEHVMRHFNWESYAEELEQDFVTIDAPGGNVWVYWAH